MSTAKHSALGIASFVISLIAFISFVSGVTLSGVMEDAGVIAGLPMMFGSLLSVIGAGSGMSSLVFGEYKRKLYALLGILIASIPLALTVVILWVATS